MTPLMETLYRYLIETKLDAFLLQYPEYPDYLRCAGEQEGQLRARLGPGEARLLDDMLRELWLGRATEREAVFQAALALSRELGKLASAALLRQAHSMAPPLRGSCRRSRLRGDTGSRPVSYGATP